MCDDCPIPWRCCRDCGGCNNPECDGQCRCLPGPACETKNDAELELLGLILQPPSIVM